MTVRASGGCEVRRAQDGMDVGRVPNQQLFARDEQRAVLGGELHVAHLPRDDDALRGEAAHEESAWRNDDRAPLTFKRAFESAVDHCAARQFRRSLEDRARWKDHPQPVFLDREL